MATTILASGLAPSPSGSRSIASTSSGRLLALVRTATTIQVHGSNNGGTSWAEAASLRLTHAGGFAGASLFVDVQDRIHLVAVHADTSATNLWTSPPGLEVWLATSPLALNSGGTNPDMVAFPHPTDTTRFMVAVVDWSFLFNATMLYVAQFLIGSGAFESSASSTLNAGGSTAATTPVIDFNHTGDGKTVQAGAPHLFVTFNEDATGGDALWHRRLLWNGSGWESDGSIAKIADEPCGPPAMFFDGVRSVIAFNPSAGADVLVVERDASNTVTTNRHPIPLDEGNLTGLTCAYDGDRSIYVGAIGTTTDDPKYAKFDRLAGTWSAWSALEATTAVKITAKRGFHQRGIDFGYERSGTDYRHARIVINHAPSTPTWDVPEPILHNVAGGLLLEWNHLDSDGDAQVQYKLTRVDADTPGATQWWTGAAWTGVDTAVVSGTQSVTIPTGAGTLGADGDVWDYRVQTYDGALWSANYSGAKRVTLSTPSNPTITAPTGTIGTANTSASWTVAEQTARQVSLYDSTGTVLLWTSPVETTASLSRPIEYALADGVTYTVKVQTWNNEGLASSVVSGTFSVDYVEPATPFAWAVEDVPEGAITVHLLNPPPSGTQPTVVSSEVWVRVVGDQADGDRPTETQNPSGIRIATDVTTSTWIDWAAASTYEYEYRVRAVGANGTVAWSPWTQAGIAGALLGEAIVHIAASSYIGTGNYPNLGTLGTAVDAVPAGGGNSPAFRFPLDASTKHVRLTLNSASNVSHLLSGTPAGSNLELVCRIAADDYTPGTEMVLFDGHMFGAPSFLLKVHTGGTLRFQKNGTEVASSAPGLTDLTAYWIKVTHDWVTGATSFYKASDAAVEPGLSGWVLISSTTLLPGVPFGAAAVVVVGSLNDTTLTYGGRIYRAVVRYVPSGGSGPVVTPADLDPNLWEAGAFIPGGLSGSWSMAGPRVYVIDRPCWEYDANDRALFPVDPFGAHVNLTGVSGSFVSTPLSGAGGIGDTFTIDWDGALSNWAPGAGISQALVGQWGTSVALRAWLFRQRSDGKQELLIGDGTTTITATATVAPSAPALSAAARIKLRATYTRNTGGGNYRVRFYESTDAVTWTQIGADVTAASIGATNNPATEVGVGASAAGTLMNATGRVYGVRTYTTDLGSTVSTTYNQRFDAYGLPRNGIAGGSYLAQASSLAERWTLGPTGVTVTNGNPFNFRASGDRSSFTFTMRALVNTPATGQAFYGNRAGSSATHPGHSFRVISGNLQGRVCDGVVEPSGTPPAIDARTWQTWTVVRDTVADTITLYVNGALNNSYTDTTTQAVSSDVAPALGAVGGPPAAASGVMLNDRFVLHERALTAAEVGTLHTALSAAA